MNKRNEISNLTKKRIEELLDKGKRIDGRKKFDLRKIKIETGVSKKAEGSARVIIGNTEVLAGVKMGFGEPYPDSPDQGTMMVTAELYPMASENFEMGPPDIQAIELARLVDRGIRESEFIDFKKLCVKKGELVWTVFIDIYPINDDGNLIDASALAAAVALKSAVFPAIKDDKVQYGEFTTKKLPLKVAPITMTFYKIGNNFVLDPVAEEEQASKTRITVSVTFQGKDVFIHALQKSGEEAFSEEEIMSAIKDVSKESKKILSLLGK